jgi:hypothetical protein
MAPPSPCPGGVIAGPALPALAPGVALQPSVAIEHQPEKPVMSGSLSPSLYKVPWYPGLHPHVL